MTFFVLLGANLKLIYRNRQALFWSLAFPILFLFIFGLFALVQLREPDAEASGAGERGTDDREGMHALPEEKSLKHKGKDQIQIPHHRARPSLFPLEPLGLTDLAHKAQHYHPSQRRPLSCPVGENRLSDCHSPEERRH